MSKTKPTFIPGSNCLYFKIYSSTSCTDNFLAFKLTALVSKLEAADQIIKWFYIRYNDPEDHLRLRFFVHENTKTDVWLLVNAFLEDEMKTGQIKNIEMSTYQRELIRYGSNRIELIESLWSYESNLLTKALSELTHEDYLVFCIVLSNKYLKEFYDDDSSFLKHLKEHVNSFFIEFSLDSKNKKILNQKFKLISESLLHELNSKDLIGCYDELITPIIDHITQINNTLKQSDKTNLVSDLLHMFFNRCFYADQRLVEMTCYHHLQSLFYLNKYNNA